MWRDSFFLMLWNKKWPPDGAKRVELLKYVYIFNSLCHVFLIKKKLSSLINIILSVEDASAWFWIYVGQVQ